MTVRILNCDVMEGLRLLADESVHCVVTDPPYGETSLDWDRAHAGWLREVRRVLRRDGSAWVFGSLRSHIATDFDGWQIAQDVVWEKHNGSNSFADRFRRVHEIAVQIYRSDARWADVYKAPLYTNDARARVVRRKQRPPHWGDIGASSYRSVDAGPRLMRSVMFYRSCHGEAVHPTQKPEAVMAPLIEYSCPPGGGGPRSFHRQRHDSPRRGATRPLVHRHRDQPEVRGDGPKPCGTRRRVVRSDEGVVS